MFLHTCSISQGEQWGNPYAAWGSGYQTGYGCAQAYHAAYNQAPAYNQWYDPWNNQMGYAQAGIQS